jgi:c-di-GMP-binding flagellar brake protein YcgR
MAPLDLIQGKSVAGIIDQLIAEKTLLGVQIPAKAFQRVSVLLDRRLINNLPHFQLDTPKELKAACQSVETNLVLHFEFTGRDKLRYQFTCHGSLLLGDHLWVSMPESIRRIQNRSHFRVETPHGSKLRLKLGDSVMDMQLGNLSLSGAFADVQVQKRHGPFQPVLSVGQSVTGIEISFPTHMQVDPIQIKQGTVVRMDTRRMRLRVGFGFHFLEIDAANKRSLTSAIYTLQRNFLKSRLKIHD